MQSTAASKLPASPRRPRSSRRSCRRWPRRLRRLLQAGAVVSLSPSALAGVDPERSRLRDPRVPPPRRRRPRLQLGKPVAPPGGRPRPSAASRRPRWPRRPRCWAAPAPSARPWRSSPEPPVESREAPARRRGAAGRAGGPDVAGRSATSRTGTMEGELDEAGALLRRGGGWRLLVPAAVLVEMLDDVASKLFHLGVRRFASGPDFPSQLDEPCLR